MKKRIILAIVFLLTLVKMSAEDMVTIKDFSISAGETKEMIITLDNDVSYVGFQFDLYLPEGITLTEFSANKTRIPESATLTMTKRENGCYRFLAAAMDLKEIKGTSGSIITIKVAANENMESGNLTGSFQKVKLSKTDGTGTTYAEMSFPITILAPSTVTAKSYERTYGEANPIFDFDVEGGALDGVPEIICEATESSPVGNYDIIIKRGTETNLNVTYIKGTLTITKAPLTITAKDYTVKQGEPLPSFEATYEGFKNSETPDVLTKQPSFTTTATSDSNLGEYVISVSGAEAQNYDIIHVRGKLTIVKADALIITAKDYTIEYGDEIPTFEYTSDGTTLSGTPSITCEAKKGSPAGTYDIVISKGSVTNYNDTYVNGKLTIKKAPLTITAKDYTIKQGEALPTFEATYEGFKNNETSAVLTKQPTITTMATSTSAIGEYVISVSGAESQNYEIIYVKGKLTIAAVEVITPVTEDEEVSFNEQINEGADLSDTVIENTYFTLDTDNGDGYDAEEKAIVLNSTTTEEQMKVVQEAKVGDKTVQEEYFGVIFEIAPGSGTVTVDAKTIGKHALNVRIGKAEPTKVTSKERSTADISFSVNEPTYVYLYASSEGADAARAQRAPSAAENSVLLYGYKVTLDEPELGDANGDGKVDAADIADIVNHTIGKPTSTGKFIEAAADVNGDGIVNTADIVKIVNIIMGN